MISALLISCGKVSPTETTTSALTEKPETTTSATKETTTQTTPEEATTQTTTTEKPAEPEKPEERTLKILAIGNSFSQDSMEYIALAGNPALTDAQMDEALVAFTIFVPVK